MTYRINVLWIDDEPTDGFIDKAAMSGIDLMIAETVEDGMRMLDDKTNIFEAIILDANCKISNIDKQEDLSALSHAIAGIYARSIDIPWFVYTAGGYEGFELIEKIIPQQFRNWDTKAYYTKPGTSNTITGQSIEELFIAIKRAVEQSEITKTKRKYGTVLSIYNGRELLDLLIAQTNRNFSTDENIPNAIRKIADSICYNLRNNGFLGIDPDKTNVIGDCSRYFAYDKQNKYVPKHIQGALHYLSAYYCNPGSHGHDPEKPLPICKHIRSGEAPYVNIIGINCLLEFISWYGSLDLDNKEYLKDIQIDFSHWINKAR